MKKLVVVVVGAAFAFAAKAKQAEIRPGELWHDTAGHVINAHGCGVMYDRGTYWWYGEHKVYGVQGNRAHVGVHVYSSADLVNWDDRGIALAVSDAQDSDIVDGCVIERPKVVFCPKTGKYSMFFHLELKGRGYKAARVGIAVADRPEGPFKFLRSLQPNGEMSRDMTLFVDDDGKAYHVFASENNKTTHIDELTDDFLDYTGKSWRMAVDESTEAQCMVKEGGCYWMIGSGCTGWAPNRARLYRAKKLEGPWERLGNPCRGINPASGLGPNITWGAQSSFLLPVAGRPGKVIAMFDIWKPANHTDSRYVWLPVSFEGDRLWIDWCTSWRPEVAPQPKAAPLRFMTFNIWGDYFGNPVEERQDGVANTILKERPTFVSLQEVTKGWYDGALFKTLSDSGYVTLRGDEELALYRAYAENGSKDAAKYKHKGWVNHEPLVYDDRRLACLDSGVEFYHLRLQVEKSVTWGVFEDRGSGRRLIAFATHLWWKKNSIEDEVLRELNMRKILDTLAIVKSKWGDLPVIGGGDLNCDKTSSALKQFNRSGFVDAMDVADERDERPSEHRNPKRDPVTGKYHGVAGVVGVPGNTFLDHVFFTPGSIHALKQRVIIDQEALDVSDHSPVVVDFELK